MGVTEFLAAIVLIFSGQPIVAGTLASTALLEVAMAAVLGRMEGKFRILWLWGELPPRQTTDERTDRAPE